MWSLSGEIGKRVSIRQRDLKYEMRRSRRVVGEGSGILSISERRVLTVERSSSRLTASRSEYVKEMYWRSGRYRSIELVFFS